jgi:flagellar basal-body rod protein FlgB
MANILFDPVLAGLERALDLRVRQHELVTSNIANADTPHYKAQRVDFRASFDRAFEEILAAEGGKVARSSLDELVEVWEVPTPPGRIDGNSVRSDNEMMVLAENSIQYDATIEMMNRRFAMLEYAASDGGR